MSDSRLDRQVSGHSRGERAWRMARGGPVTRAKILAFLAASIGGGLPAHAQTPPAPVTFVVDQSVLKYRAQSGPFEAIGVADTNYGFVPNTPTRTDLSGNFFADIADISPFGGNRSKTTYFSQDTVTAENLRSTVAIGRNVDGSGHGHPNSNNYADFGAQIWAQKNGFLEPDVTKIHEGEVDGLAVIARQNAKGDVAGLIIDVGKTRGTTVDNGGASIFEGASRIYAPTTDTDPRHWTTTWSNQSLGGFAETVGGMSGGEGYGFYTRQDYGNAYAAFAAAETSSTSGGKFENIIAFGPSEQSSPEKVTFRIDRGGFIHQGASAKQIVTGFDGDEQVDAWQVRDQDRRFLFGVSRSGPVVSQGPIVGLSGFDVPVMASAAVGAPSAGFKRLFFDSADGKLKAKDSGGVVTPIAP